MSNPNTGIKIITLLLILCSSIHLHSSEKGYGNASLFLNQIVVQDTLKRDSLPQRLYMHDPYSFLFKRPVFIAVKYSGGSVAGKGKLETGYVQYAEMKIGLSSLGNRWKDIVYGMPYYGLGVGFYDFSSSQTGHPVSIYLFQGGILKAFSARSMLKYEWNFGTSFNWKRHNSVTNPGNESIGAPMNIYFAANLYHTTILTKEWDLNIGVTFNHVSNGATRMPNTGVNTLAAYIGLTYHFDRERILNEFNPTLKAPVYENSRLISDLTFHSTVRQRRFPTGDTGLSSVYIHKKFYVAGANYALLHMPTYKYRYGGGFDIIYDESAGFTIHKKGETPDGREIMAQKDGDFLGRLGLGFSLRGEIVMPKYAVSGQLGYEVIKGKKTDSRLYQIFSVRVPFWDNLYGSFSLRSQKFSKAQYMFFGIGYMIDHKPFKKK